MNSIVVTGGSGTIGGAIVNSLINEGYKVWNIDISEPTNDIDKQIFLKGDVTNYSELKRLIHDNLQYEDIVGVITVAGGGVAEEWENFVDVDIEAVKKSIDLNLLGHINVVHILMPYLVRNKSNKSIIMISSINGKAAYKLAGYSAAKAGLEGFMYGVVKEFGENNIRINIISPGTVVSELTMNEEKKDWESLRMGTITGKFVSPKDIAQLAILITKNESIDGQNMIIDSGQSIKK